MANLKDFATGTVLTAPSPATSGTTMILQNNEYLLFPPVPFYATAHPDNVLPTIANSEKILVTAINAGTQVITFARAQGVATAKSIAAGWRISNTIFAADLYNGSIVQNETPGGSINGTNKAYTIVAAFTPGSLAVYLNGQRLRSGSGNDYTENSSLTGFTMNYAPLTGDSLSVDYTIGSSVIMNGTNVRINQETPTGSVNGSNTAFTTARAYISGSLEVYVNGLLQAPTTHVTEVSPTAGTFSLDTAPSTGDIVRVSYQYATSTGGNAASVNGIAASVTPTANQLVPLDNNALVPNAALGVAWPTWTPTVTNTGGTISATVNFAKYTQIGKSVFWKISITVNSVSATGSLRFTPPVAAAAEQAFTGSGREDAATGKMIEVMFKSTVTVISCFFYDNTGATATAGYNLVMNGIYEAA